MACSYLSPEVARCRGDLRQSRTARIILETNNSPSYRTFLFSILSAHLLLHTPFQTDSLLLTYSFTLFLRRRKWEVLELLLRAESECADRWLYLLLLKVCKPKMEGKPEVGAPSSFCVCVNESSTSPLRAGDSHHKVYFSGDSLLTGGDLSTCICQLHTLHLEWVTLLLFTYYEWLVHP